MLCLEWGFSRRSQHRISRQNYRDGRAAAARYRSARQTSVYRAGHNEYRHKMKMHAPPRDATHFTCFLNSLSPTSNFVCLSNTPRMPLKIPDYRTTFRYINVAFTATWSYLESPPQCFSFIKHNTTHCLLAGHAHPTPHLLLRVPMSLIA